MLAVTPNIKSYATHPSSLVIFLNSLSASEDSFVGFLTCLSGTWYVAGTYSVHVFIHLGEERHYGLSLLSHIYLRPGREF